MLPLGAGLLALGALLWAANAFSRASIPDIRRLLFWIAALAGLSLTTLLFLTGRGPAALSALVLLGPLGWNLWQGRRPPPRPGRAAPRSGPMTRAEALSVLGLHEGASEAEIRAAWVRLMQVAHPDHGGSDWLAARVNQAKDVLLQR